MEEIRAMPADDTTPVNWLTFGLSCVTRLLFWGSTIYVIYLCTQSEYSLITLHVAFSTIGCGLLMVEATLAVSGDALLVARLSKGVRVRIHLILHTLGLAAVLAGMGTMMTHTIRYGSLYLGNIHKRLGVLAIILALLITLGAIPILYRRLVPRSMNFQRFKRTHIYLGIISIILLWASQITGFYTGWWMASNITKDLTVAAYAVGGFLLLAAPFYRTLWRSFYSH